MQDDETAVTSVLDKLPYHIHMAQPASATPEGQHRPLEAKRKAEAIPLLSPHELPDHTAFRVPLKLLRLDPNQPRKQLDDAALQDLAESIAVWGVVNPLTVQRVDGGYKIIAGERRFRAAQHAGLLEVPVHIVTDEHMLARIFELQLVENLQREDLNPYDEAVALAKLRDEQKLSVRDLAARLNVSKSNVARKLQILEMPEHLQASLKQGSLSLNEAERQGKEAKESVKSKEASRANRHGKPPKLFNLSKRKNGGFDLSIKYRPDLKDRDQLIGALEILLSELKNEKQNDFSSSGTA